MDGYEYDDNRRLRWVLIGAAVLGGAALLATGFGLGRASAPTTGAARGATAAGQAGPGPSRVVNGVPVGYAHTEAGAAAATNFLMVMGGSLIAQPDKYRSAISTMAAPTTRSRQLGAADQDMAAVGLVGYAQQGKRTLARAVPLAYHVDQYSDDRAQVSIWAEGFIGVDGVLPMSETWSTSVMTVEWTGGDWRLLTIGRPTPQSKGPVPVISQPSIQGPALPGQVTTFTEYRNGIP